MTRRFIVLGASLVGFAVIVAGLAVFLLVATDLRPFAEKILSGKMGRPVTMQSLIVRWGNPVTVDATGLHLANLPWGSTPDMVAVDRVQGEIAFWPLLHGEFHLNHVMVERPVIVLERDSDGSGNWNAASSRTPGTIKQPSKPPVRFIGAMQVHDGDLTFRTTKHNLLRIHVADADLRSAGDEAPVIVAATGSYNDVPLGISMTLESFAALRQVPRPVATDIAAFGTRTKLVLTGTMTDPLGFDGIKGNLTLSAETLQEIGSVIGTTALADLALALYGTLDRQGDRWLWTGLSGFFDGAAVDGMIELNEGGKGIPDRYDIALDLGAIDLQHLGLDRIGQTGLSLHPSESPDELFKIAARITAVTYRNYKFDAIGLNVSVAPSMVTLGNLSFGFAGGQVGMTGSLQAAGKGGRMELNATASGMDAARILGIAGANTPSLAGKLDAGARMKIEGNTLTDGLGASDGALILSMTGGHIAREFLQLASTDVRVLVQKATGQVPIDCLLGVGNMRNGIVAVAPLRLKTQEGNLFGSGQLDLRRQSMDLLVQSESRSTEFWALDIPLRFTGNFTNPHAQPSAGSDPVGVEAGGTANTGQLPSALRPPVGQRCR